MTASSPSALSLPPPPPHPQSYDLLRKWGVTHILGEWMPTPFRPSQALAEEARMAAANALSPDEGRALPRGVPPFDPDVFLGGRLRRVFHAGRFDVLEVR